MKFALTLYSITPTVAQTKFIVRDIAENKGILLRYHQAFHQISFRILRNDGCIDVPRTVERLAEISTHYALAGADVIAPSDMMDGRSSYVLFSQIRIVSLWSFQRCCSVCSFFWRPPSLPASPGAKGLALRAAIRDANEGAEFIMVKPGLPYLDILSELRQLLPHHPLAVYHVSGEYAMLRHAANAGAIDLKQAALEIMTAFRRAGASIIITYLTPYLLDLDLSEACK
ncbi:unnamed protein product [Heterobilharzia americana]|nr:unnamed protein product [Heterobilharzia americana]